MLRLFKYKVPFKTSFKTALGEFTYREGIILMYEENGIQAFGEVSPLPEFSKESLNQIEVVLTQNKTFLSQGLKDDSFSEIIQVLDQIHDFPSLSFGLDSLNYDLKAKRDNKSLESFLFKKETQSIVCNTTIGIKSNRDVISSIYSKVSEGFETIKIKVGQDFGTERSILKNIRNEFPKINIRIDANQAWNTEEAIKNLNSVSDLRIEYCEQPVSGNNILGLKKVTTNTEINIAADEALGNKMQVKELIENSCCDLIILKPALIGLFKNIYVTKQLAETHNMEVVFTTLLDGVIGRTITAILASGLGSRKYAHGLATGSLLNEQEGVLENIHKGAFHFSNSEGIGLPIDINLLEEII